jgi:(p)ppGpp synthase/HD superfamily hydrolase
MILTERLQKAIDTAALLHRDHTRIGKKKIPYISHLIHVLAIVDRYSQDEDVLIAALLHDTIEDIPEYTAVMLERDFGSRVKDIVISLSEDRDFDSELSPKERWVQAKKSYLAKLLQAGYESHLISAADKIHNMSSIVEGFRNKDDIVMLRFEGVAMIGQVWFTEEVYKIISKTIPAELAEEYAALHAELKVLVPLE